MDQRRERELAREIRTADPQRKAEILRELERAGRQAGAAKRPREGRETR